MVNSQLPFILFIILNSIDIYGVCSNAFFLEKVNSRKLLRLHEEKTNNEDNSNTEIYRYNSLNNNTEAEESNGYGVENEKKEEEIHEEENNKLIPNNDTMKEGSQEDDEEESHEDGDDNETDGEEILISTIDITEEDKQKNGDEESNSILLNDNIDGKDDEESITENTDDEKIDTNNNNIMKYDDTSKNEGSVQGKDFNQDTKEETKEITSWSSVFVENANENYEDAVQGENLKFTNDSDNDDDIEKDEEIDKGKNLNQSPENEESKPVQINSWSSVFVENEENIEKDSKTYSSDTYSNEGTNTYIKNQNNVFANYNVLKEKGQGFFLMKQMVLYESPDKPAIPFKGLYWMSDFTFHESEEDPSIIGYVGRGLLIPAADNAISKIKMAMDSNTIRIGNQQIDYENIWTLGFSSVYVPSKQIFEGQFHYTADDAIFRVFDDGKKSIPYIAWDLRASDSETHNVVLKTPLSHSSAASIVGTLTALTEEEAVEVVFGYDTTTATIFTSQSFQSLYEKAWEATNTPADVDTSSTSSAVKGMWISTTSAISILSFSVIILLQ